MIDSGLSRADKSARGIVRDLRIAEHDIHVLRAVDRDRRDRKHDSLLAGSDRGIGS